METNQSTFLIIMKGFTYHLRIRLEFNIWHRKYL